MPSAWVVRKRRERLVRTGVVICGLALAGAYAGPKVAGAVHRAIQRRQFWSRLEIADKLVEQNLTEALGLPTRASTYPGSPATIQSSDGSFVGASAQEMAGATGGRVGSQLLPFRLLYDDLTAFSAAFPPIQRAAIQSALNDFSVDWQQSVDPLIRSADEGGARGTAARVTGKLVVRLRQLR
jgi:hypothetical protein